MSGTFQVKHEGGLTLIDRKADETFRKLLMAGCPPVLQRKMHEALSDIPQAGARAHTLRYFGDELPDIVRRINPLMQSLDRVFNMHGRPGLFDWLNATGFGDHYKLIKVMAAWAEFKTGGMVNEKPISTH